MQEVIGFQIGTQSCVFSVTNVLNLNVYKMLSGNFVVLWDLTVVLMKLLDKDNRAATCSREQNRGEELTEQ